jgi:hypothetical protein
MNHSEYSPQPSTFVLLNANRAPRERHTLLHHGIELQFMPGACFMAVMVQESAANVKSSYFKAVPLAPFVSSGSRNAPRSPWLLRARRLHVGRRLFGRLGCRAELDDGGPLRQREQIFGSQDAFNFDQTPLIVRQNALSLRLLLLKFVKAINPWPRSLVLLPLYTARSCICA